MFVNSLVSPSRICVQEKLKYAIKNKTVDIIVNKFQVYYPCRNSVLFINMYMNDFVIRVCSWLHTCTLRLQEISFKMCIIMLTKFILLIPVHVMSILYNLSQIWSTSVTGMWRIYQEESFRDLPVPWCASRRLICRSISPVILHM